MPAFNPRRRMPYHANVRKAVDCQIQINQQEEDRNRVPLLSRMSDTIRHQKEKLSRKSLKIARLQVVNQNQQINMAHRELALVALRNQWKTELKEQQTRLVLQSRLMAEQTRSIDRLQRQINRIPEICRQYHCVPTGSRKRQVKTEIQSPTPPTSPHLRDPFSTEDWIEELEANGWTSPVYVPTKEPAESSPWPPQDSRLVTLAQWWTDHTRGSDPLGVVLGEQAHLGACTRYGTAAQGAAAQGAAAQETPNRTEDD